MIEDKIESALFGSTPTRRQTAENELIRECFDHPMFVIASSLAVVENSNQNRRMMQAALIILRFCLTSEQVGIFLFLFIFCICFIREIQKFLSGKLWKQNQNI